MKDKWQNLRAFNLHKCKVKSLFLVTYFISSILGSQHLYRPVLFFNAIFLDGLIRIGQHADRNIATLEQSCSFYVLCCFSEIALGCLKLICSSWTLTN